MKFNKLIIPAILSMVFLLSSCGGEAAKTGDNQEANGPVKYGGTFRCNEEADFRTLFPHAIGEVVGHRIGNQVYEGLVSLTQDSLLVYERLAESYEVLDSAKLFKFKLRKGVFFHDDPCFEDGKGRELTAHDVKYCFDRLCGAYPNNTGYAMFADRVLGAKEYYESTLNGSPMAGGVKGVRVINDYEVEIELNYPFPGFLNILTTNFCWIFPKEAIEKYNSEIRIHPVGTGPFIAKEVREGDIVYMVRNPNYWQKDEYGNQLPYLDAIKMNFIKEKKAEFLEFKRGNLDFLFRIPDDMIDHILQPQMSGAKNELELDIEKAMSIQYYGFQHAHGVFQDKRVRQAFTKCINKEDIVRFTLLGNGTAARYGVVPPAFVKYDHEKVKGHVFDPKEARRLLAEAGFPDGKGFPEISLQLNTAGASGRNNLVAEVIKKQIKENLNIDINLEIVPWAQHLENIESGRAIFYRSGWIADYPDPETFLNLYYSKHVPDSLGVPAYFNSFRYKNPEFDAVFEAALKELDEEKRMDLYLKADQIATEDAVMLALFYDENYRLRKPWVKNFPSNSMEFRDFTKVYIDKSGK